VTAPFPQGARTGATRMRRIPAPLAALGLALALSSAGCNRIPPFTEVEGKVLLNNKPLPNAKVEFVPDLPGLEGQLISVGVTDARGEFRLTCAHQSKSGAAVSKHRVVVTEGPSPQGTRGLDAASQRRYAAYREKLVNRPIPPAYGALTTTPLVVEVKPEQKVYTLHLKRR
jgi:hypothetical protein